MYGNSVFDGGHHGVAGGHGGMNTDGFYPGYAESSQHVPSSGFNQQGGAYSAGAPTTAAQGGQNLKARPDKSPREEYGRQYGVFSGSASIKFYCTEDKNGNPTITIQAANKEGAKGFDWSSKTSIQFMQKELPEFLAMLYGVLPVEEVVFDNHGDANSKKTFRIKHQPQSGGFYLSVTEKGKKLKGVPITYNDAMIIASMTLSQLCKTTELEADQVLKMMNHFIIKKKYQA